MNLETVLISVGLSVVVSYLVVNIILEREKEETRK